MNTVTLSVRQFRFEIRTYFRNTAGVIFGFLFPLIFLVFFGLIDTHTKTQTFNNVEVPSIQFLTPGIMAYGIIGATYISLALRLTLLRDQGFLKRVAGTPLPRSIYLTGQLLNSVIIGFIISALIIGVSFAFYGLHVYASTLPALILTVIVGSAAFCAMGVAISSLIPNADSAPAIIESTTFALLLISDVFYSMNGAPGYLVAVAEVFPVKHFANALQDAFNPSTHSGIDWGNLAVVAAWGLVGAFFAARYFRWEAKKS